MTNVEVQSDFNKIQDVGGDGDDDGNDQGFSDDDSIFGGNLVRYDDDVKMNIDFVDDYCPTNEDLYSFF